MGNPFSTNAPSTIINASEMFHRRKIPALQEVHETKQELNTDNAFLNDLRSFMNDFIESDLNIDSIEEPNTMTKAQANFYVKLYRQVISDEEEMNKLCDEEIERISKGINAYREQRQKEFNQKKEYFTSILQQYALGELDGKKTRTLKLPYGNLSFKKQQPKYIYNNEDEIKALLKNIEPELLKTKVSVDIDKSALKKKAVVKDNEIYIGDNLIEGITVCPQEDKFEIK